MARTKVYSLAISKQKLSQLRNKKCEVVSHRSCPLWERFFNSNPSKVKFYDVSFYDKIEFEVANVERVCLAGETHIRIHIKV